VVAGGGAGVVGGTGAAGAGGVVTMGVTGVTGAAEPEITVISSVKLDEWNHQYYRVYGEVFDLRNVGPIRICLTCKYGKNLVVSDPLVR